MMFPQTPQEFADIYADGKSVQVTMTKTGVVPEGDWEWYAKKIVTDGDGEAIEYDMWFRVVPQ